VVELFTVAFGLIPVSTVLRGSSVEQGYVFPTLAHPNEAGVDDLESCLEEISLLVL